MKRDRRTDHWPLLIAMTLLDLVVVGLDLYILPSYFTRYGIGNPSTILQLAIIVLFLLDLGRNVSAMVRKARSQEESD